MTFGLKTVHNIGRHGWAKTVQNPGLTFFRPGIMIQEMLKNVSQVVLRVVVVVRDAVGAC
jgi:hypothetical protein